MSGAGLSAPVTAFGVLVSDIGDAFAFIRPDSANIPTSNVPWHSSRLSAAARCCLLLSAAPTRQEDNPVVKIPSIQDSEQLYAVATILPFANMQELDLSGLQLSNDQWCALLESVSRCTGLRVLSIKGCALGTLGTCRV